MSCVKLQDIVLQEKVQIKEKKERDEAIFKYAQVDGRTEQVRPCSFAIP